MATKSSNSIGGGSAGVAPRWRFLGHGEPIERAASILLLSMSVLFLQPVHAQSETAAASEGLEEVVVTADKRSESIQNVPIAVTAFTADQLEKRQIQSAVDLAGTVPNLTINLPNGDQQPVFSIRGINTADFSIGQNGPVAVYYDEVYKGTTAIQGVGLFDLQRVEVLKGPQGTLYGKNTTGGAINFISRVPDFSTKGNVTVGYGNYDHFHADGGAQTAIGDTVAGRLAFTVDRADGWQRNLASGEPDLSSVDNYGLRGTLLVKPSDAVEFILRASASHSTPFVPGGAWIPVQPQGIGFPSYPTTGANGVLLEPEPAGNPREAYVLSPHRDVTKTNAVSATANVQLGDALTLTSISSWDHGSQRLPFDGYTRIGILRNFFYGQATQVAQDLRLTSQYSGPFNFIAGVYYNRERVKSHSLTSFLFDVDVNGDGAVDAADCIAGGFFPACSIANQFEQLKKSTAVYTDASYAFSEHFKMRAGLRYTHDQGDLTGLASDIGDINGVPLLNIIPGVAGQTASLSLSDSNVSGRFGLDYNVSNDILLYASYSRGYRGAAFNNQAFFSLSEVNVADPETLASYELGFKSEFLAHRVRLNGAVFHMDYKNQQVLSFNPDTTSTQLVSLGASRVRGGELELDVQVAEGLRLFSSVGVVDAKVVRGRANGVDVSGRHLQNAPNLTASAGFDWDSAITEKLRCSVHFDGAYTGKQYFDLVNNPLTTEGGYTLLNGRIRFSDANDRIGFSLWGKNLADRSVYTTISLTNFIGSNYVILNAPRTYGVSVDAKF